MFIHQVKKLNKIINGMTSNIATKITIIRNVYEDDHTSTVKPGKVAAAPVEISKLRSKRTKAHGMIVIPKFEGTEIIPKYM